MKRPKKSLKLLTMIVLILFLLTSSTYFDPKAKQTLFGIGEIFSVNDNAPPIAQFATDKTEYRIGEPIEYIDLSYDPELDGISPTWEGKEKAFFTPGEHVVTLTVKDNKGAESRPFSRTIKVSNEVFTTKEEYPFYFGSPSGDPNSVPINLESYEQYPSFIPKEKWIKNRKVVVSNDPEIFGNYGLLYEERITGKARLYATHVNGMKQSAQVFVLATNPTASPATIHITRKGDVYPSKYPGLLGNEALVDWFANQQRTEEYVLAPGETITYYESPTLEPDQGIHFIQDITVEGQVVFSFLSSKPTTEQPKRQNFQAFPRKKDVRGTFDVSEINWEVDASQSHGKPWRIIVGDDSQWVPGKDAMTGSYEKNKGNYGVFYNIVIKNPGKATISIVPRGGSVKGPLLFNDKITLVPESGVVAPGTAYIIGHTTGKEGQIKFTLCPPSGSSMPYDIFVYPLDQRQK